VRSLALILIAAVEIGGSFGTASASVTDLARTSMTVDIQVEVRSSAQAVVAHLSFGDDPTLTLPLLDRGGGVFGLRTELDRKNYLVVFEAVGDPEGVTSPVSLTDMGAVLLEEETGDPIGSEGDDGGLSAQTQSLGWLALALGAASLSVLAFWVLGGRRDRELPADTDE
jgi:hypothetical protein